MKFKFKKYFQILISLLLLTQTAKAQLFDDWQARPSLSLGYKINNKWATSATFYQYFDNNISSFDKSVFGADVNYKIISWLKAEFDYRYGIDKSKNYHDLRYSLNFKPYLNFSRFHFSYRPLFQQKLSHSSKPDNYLRNLVKMDYEINDVITIFALTENYLKLYHGAENHTQKYAVGCSAEVSDQSEIEFQFTVEDRIGEKLSARLELSYSYNVSR